MAEKIIKGDTFIRDGNTNAESLTVNNDKSTSGIAGSIATVKKDSDSDATDVAVFFDVSKINTADQLSAEVYALVSRVVNSVNFNGKGLVGANLVGRNTGNGDFEYINGAFSTASNQGGGNVDFLIANNVKSSVTGSDTCTIDIMRADSGDVEINNVNATVNNAQGMHPSVQMTNGTIGEVVGIYVDLDYDNTGSVTVTGDIAYIRSGNDNLPTVGGNIYFIKSDAPHPSEFAGSITAPDFIGNFNGQPASYYNFRNFGLGDGVQNNPAFTGDVLTITDTGYRRVASTATNLPISANGFLRSIYRTSTFKTYEYISDSGRIFYFANMQWIEIYNTGTATINPVLDTSTTDLITTSTGVNDVVYSYTIPANTLQVGDILNLKCYAINSGGATSGGVVFNFGGVGLNISNGLTVSGGSSPVIDIDVEIIITSTTGFRYNSRFEIKANNFSSGNTYNGRVTQDYSAGSFDTTTDEDLKLTVNNPVNGDVVIKTISVKHFKA
jgi:hypothetical protein